MAAPTATDPTAVVGRRVVATLIDGAVVVGPTLAIATTNMEYITRERVGRRFDDFCDDYLDQFSGSCIQLGDTAYFSDDSANPGGFAFIGLSILLLVVLQGITGWTIGKLLTGLRTVREDGRAPGIGKAFLRWLLSFGRRAQVVTPERLAASLNELRADVASLYAESAP